MSQLASLPAGDGKDSRRERKRDEHSSDDVNDDEKVSMGVRYLQIFGGRQKQPLPEKKSVSLFDHIYVYYLFIYFCLILPIVAVHVDALILFVQLKHSGYGDHVGHSFVGCTLYADDTALLSASYYG